MKTGSLQPALHRTQILLDKLPAGAVILDKFGHAWQQGGQYRFGSPEYASWYRAYGDDASKSSWELAQLGPVKILEVRS